MPIFKVQRIYSEHIYVEAPDHETAEGVAYLGAWLKNPVLERVDVEIEFDSIKVSGIWYRCDENGDFWKRVEP